MRYEVDRLTFSATDLSRNLACSHLTSLGRAVALGETSPPLPYDDPRAEVLKQRGIEHERRILEQLAAEGRTVATITDAAAPFSHRDWTTAAARTVDAMRRGVDLVYQGRLEDADGRWSGYPRFPDPGGAAERAGRLVVRGGRREAGARGPRNGTLAAPPVLRPAVRGAGTRARAGAPRARRERRPHRRQLPGRGVRRRTTAPSAGGSRRTPTRRRRPIRNRSSTASAATGTATAPRVAAPTTTSRWWRESRTTSGSA